MRRPPISAPDERNAGRLDEGEPSDVVFERVDRLAAEFLERRRRGEHPTIEEYVAGHPDLAAAIRELFPALVMVEGLKPGSDETFGVPGGPDAPAEGAPPDRLGDYRILREIGRGGMGVVYEAEQESLGRRVALKVLGSWAGASEAQVRRFHREARAAAQLHHTHIVPVFDVGEHAGRHFYTMQFIHGAGLHQVIDEVRRLEGIDPGATEDPAVGPDDGTVVEGAARSFLSGWLAPVGSGRGGMIPGSEWSAGPAEAIGAAERMASAVVDSRRRSVRIVARIGLQVAEALAHAHEQGVLHRDIKPSNILIDGHGHAWVTDFGLAKAVDDEDLTHTGDLVGTIRYMAPERFRGECDPRSDVYALGLTLYELLGRRPAFPDSDRHALMSKVAHADPPRLESLAAGIPRDLATIVHKAIEKAPADRYRSGAAMASDLRRFLDDRPIEARRIGLPERLLRWARRNPGVAALATAVAVLLVAIAAISTVAALRLREQELKVERRLWEADLARARASRRSGIEGRRFDALAALSEAARLDAHPEGRAVLRDEAIACLALADLGRIGGLTLPALSSRGHVLAFSPDGRRLAVGEDQGLVRVLDAAGGPASATLRGPGGNAALLRFSDDGRRLAVRYAADRESVLRVYDLGTGAVPIDQPLGRGAAALDFDTSGARLAFALHDGTVRIEDLDGRRDPVRITVAREPDILRFDPTGRRLAISWHEPKDSVLVVDLEGPGVVGRWSLPDGVLSLAWSPDGRQLAAGSGYRDIFLLDPGEPSSPARVLRGHKGAVVSLDYARRGHLLASASWDGTVRLWHPESGEPLVVASSPDHWSVRFGPDDRTLGGGRDGSTCWRWEVADGDELRSRHVDVYPDSRIWPMAFFPDGSLFASAGSAGVHIFDAELRPVALLPVSGFATLPHSGFAAVEVFPDGQSLLTGGPSGLRRWPVRREAGGLRVGPSAPFGPMPGRLVRRVRVDARGRRVAAVLDPSESTVAVFDADGAGRPIQIQDHFRLERIDLSPDGRLVATGTWKGRDVKVWDAATGELIIALKVDGSAEVAFSPDGRSLLTGSGREYVCWDVGSWTPRWTLPRREASNLPGRVAFTADSALMAVAWSRTLVRLVDARTGAVVASFEAPTTDHLAELGLSRDGAYLFVKDHGGGTRRWDLRAIRDRLDAMGIGWPELPPMGPDRRIPPVPPVRATPTPDRERPARVLPPGRPGGAQAAGRSGGEVGRVPSGGGRSGPGRRGGLRGGAADEELARPRSGARPRTGASLYRRVPVPAPKSVGLSSPTRRLRRAVQPDLLSCRRITSGAP